MLSNVEQAARESRLHLSGTREDWTADVDWPHFSQFEYQLGLYTESEELNAVGRVDGYRIAHDWAIDDDVTLWDEADALDGDAVRYVEALIRELRICDRVFGSAPSLASVQHVTIVRHVEAYEGVETSKLSYGAVACVAMVDAPTLMLVDPWPAAEERRSPAGKLKGRGNVPRLQRLGFTRMIGSRFVWAWNQELSESAMAPYSYSQLLASRKSGRLDDILKAAISTESYGPLPPGVVDAVDVPDPDELLDE